MQLVCACRGSRLVWVFLCNESESLVDNNTTTLDTSPILSLQYLGTLYLGTLVPLLWPLQAGGCLAATPPAGPVEQPATY